MKYLFAVTSVVLLTLISMTSASASAAEEAVATDGAIVAVAEAQERSRETTRLKRVQKKPVRMKAKQAKKYLSSGAKAPRYTCDNDEDECTCDGVADCLKLAGSGDCKGGHMWEDGDDPSKGGCDIGD